MAMWPSGSQPMSDRSTITCAPVFASWQEYLAKTTPAERRLRCRLIAKRANRQRLLSPSVSIKLLEDDVWTLIEAAEAAFIVGPWRSKRVHRAPTGPRFHGSTSADGSAVLSTYGHESRAAITIAKTSPGPASGATPGRMSGGLWPTTMAAIILIDARGSQHRI